MEYIFLLAIIIILILLFAPMKIKIEYIGSNGKSQLNIFTYYLFGLFNPEIYPFDKREDKKHGHTSLLNKLKSINRDPKKKKYFHYIWDKLIFKSISWETKIGIRDPALLGIVYGFIWNLKSTIIGFLSSKKSIRIISIDVVPIFEEDKLDIRFDCIIKIRMVYIIIIWLWIKKIIKGGDEIVRASN